MASHTSVLWVSSAMASSSPALACRSSFLNMPAIADRCQERSKQRMFSGIHNRKLIVLWSRSQSTQGGASNSHTSPSAPPGGPDTFWPCDGPHMPSGIASTPYKAAHRVQLCRQQAIRACRQSSTCCRAGECPYGRHSRRRSQASKRRV